MLNAASQFSTTTRSSYQRSSGTERGLASAMNPPVLIRPVVLGMFRAAARAAACSAGAAALSRRHMASSAGSTSVHSFSGTLWDGRPLPLASPAGRPALIVNVASE